MIVARRWKNGVCGLALAASLVVLAAGTPATAGDARLVAQTKLRLSVAQWSPAKGAYQDWPALSGEFVIADSGKLVLPVVGALDVAHLDSEGIAHRYAEQLKVKTGLLRAPEVTISVLEYPPVYVVGDVTTPGEYAFRPGLSTLQAFAMSGGLKRDEKETSNDHVRLLFDLQSSKTDILRSRMRIERLNAEMANADAFDFPKRLQDGDAAQTAALEQLYRREDIIFSTRRKELQRQTVTLNELRDLLKAEIDALNKKGAATDDAVQSTEKELAGVRNLVQKGVVIRSRQSDLERVLAGLRADRLDQVTAVMRARQSIAEATRNIDGLQDQHQTEIAQQLQTERINLEQGELKRDLTRSLLLKSIEDDASRKETQAALVTQMTLVRNENGRTVTLPAADDTPLMPGDVLKVDRHVVSPPPGDEPAASVAPAQELSRADP